jgi:hypothetical protein
MKSELPVTFEPPKLEELPIELKAVASPKKPKPKDRKAMAEAQAFAKFGVQVLRVKARVLAALGREAEQCGIKQIGHGKILLASDNAEAAISKLGGIIDGLLAQEPGPDYELVLEVMQLQKEFNGQLIKTAEAHFNADKQPMAPPMNNNINIPYPAGTAVMIGVGKVPSANGA